ncbi:helix-turn-helix domain-containing protein [Halococcus morrhuae DSM 1307]|uniref:helix-turn-helix domain-containing protein n=1 Tax=Halococcus morrhuae TaxID=2250 RepID=UPI003F839B3E
MSVIAECSLDPGRLSLAAALSAVPTIELDIEREYRTGSSSPIVFCWARDDDLDAFEIAVGDDGTVTDVHRLSNDDDRRLYRARLTGTAPVVTYDAWVDLGAARLEMRYLDERWYARMRFPDRDSLGAFRQFCVDNDLDFRLRKLYDGNSDRAHEARLTTRQREALRLAHQEGYFEIPRRTTLGEIAARLGISDQAASERLRRGCGRVVGDRFG